MDDKTDTPVTTPTPTAATAVPVVSTTVPSGGGNTNDTSSAVPMHLQPKQGAKCCGCCCDYRRAVIIIAVIFMFLNILTLIVTLYANRASNNDIDVVVDDEAQLRRRHLALDTYTEIVRYYVIATSISIATAICAICGAKNYNTILVGIDVAWTLVGWTIDVFVQISLRGDFNDIVDDDENQIVEVNAIQITISFIITCLLIYPSVGFIYEVQKGIMSAETYPREEYSCCKN